MWTYSRPAVRCNRRRCPHSRFPSKRRRPVLAQRGTNAMVSRMTMAPMERYLHGWRCNLELAPRPRDDRRQPRRTSVTAPPAQAQPCIVPSLSSTRHPPVHGVFCSAPIVTREEMPRKEVPLGNRSPSGRICSFPCLSVVDERMEIVAIYGSLCPMRHRTFGSGAQDRRFIWWEGSARLPPNSAASRHSHEGTSNDHRPNPCGAHCRISWRR